MKVFLRGICPLMGTPPKAEFNPSFGTWHPAFGINYKAR